MANFCNFLEFPQGLSLEIKVDGLVFSLLGKMVESVGDKAGLGVSYRRKERYVAAVADLWYNIHKVHRRRNIRT